MLLFLDQGSEIRDQVWVKIRIRDKHPGSATLLFGVVKRTDFFLLVRKIGKSTNTVWIPGRLDPTAKVFRLMFVLGPETGKGVLNPLDKMKAML